MIEDEALGKGAFGSVHRAQSIRTEEEVAIKFVKKSMLNKNEMLREQMLKELEILLECRHTNIMEIRQLLEDDEHYYVVCEFLEGGELMDRILKRKILVEKNISYIVYQILLAVNYMHEKKIAHRDLKPQNILMESKDPNNLTIKVSDLGFSCYYNEEGMKHVMGTPLFMAPEFFARRSYTSKVDIWAIGVITYLMLTGCLPFKAPVGRQLEEQIMRKPLDLDSRRFKNVSMDARDFLSLALEKSPDERPTAA